MNSENLSSAQKWEKATLANKFLFYKIFTHNTDMCKHLLEILLHVEIEKITPPQGEETFDVDFEAHGIRLDVYVKNESEAYDLEMQTVDTKELPKRTRYYQGLMDVDNLKKGETYDKLPKSYVIFLCLEDIFGEEMPVYTFQNICEEKKDLKLGDETYKIFFNARKYDKMLSEEERDFFKYLTGGAVKSDFTDKLDQLVSEAKHNAQWRHQFMTWEQEVQISYRNGVDDGIEQGIEQTKIETAKRMAIDGLSEETISKYTGLSIEEIQKLVEEKD